MTSLFLLGALSAAVVGANGGDTDRMAWWRDARFGLFIHWGLYSILGGEYKGKVTTAEWIMEAEHIPVSEYEQLRAQFNPVKFNAKEWADLAKTAGMRYMVITTKHHDGFDLFDSKAGDYTVMSTPFHRDIMKELSNAVRADGLHMGWYHSIMDWHHPDYTPPRPWNPRQGGQKTIDKYAKYLQAQVTELLTHYGKIDVMWFDGEWEPSWVEPHGRELYDLCRKLQPQIIVNNRVSNARAGSTESSDSKGVGDFTTPEQYIPTTGLPGVDWESCVTMNNNWGWHKDDHNWKSTPELIHMLVDVVSKGGNLLLNVGPKPDGTFPQEAVERLKGIGAWMKVNSESIYGTQASRFQHLTWGRSTTKTAGANTNLYFQVFEFPKDGKLVIPGLASEPTDVSLLGGGKLPFKRDGDAVDVTLPALCEGSIVPVVKVTVVGDPVVYEPPQLSAPMPIFVNTLTIKSQLRSSALQVRYTLDGSDPSAASPVSTGDIVVTRSCVVKAAAFHGGERVSGVVEYKVDQVVPEPAIDATPLMTGLAFDEYQGAFDNCPDWSTLTPSSHGDIDVPDVVLVNGLAKEDVGRCFTGYLNVPESEAYQFELASDDGSRLWVDGKLVVDCDGAHALQSASGHAALAKGYHRIRIDWFNKTGGASLRVSWGLANGALREVVKSDFAH